MSATSNSIAIMMKQAFKFILHHSWLYCPHHLITTTNNNNNNNNNNDDDVCTCKYMILHIIVIINLDEHVFKMFVLIGLDAN